MSTTRKIEGFGANRFGEYQFDVAPDENDGWEPATLIIGGKGYTEEEVSALLRRIASECHTWRDATPILLEYGLEPLNN